MLILDQTGFTLVEVVVAILVLSLVTVAVVQIYNSNVLAIITSGNRTEAVYQVQEKLELELAKDPDPAIRGELDASPLKIYFSGLDEPIEIEGWTVTEYEDELNLRGGQVSATVFIPKPEN